MPPLARGDKLGIVVENGRAHHDHVGRCGAIGNVARPVPDGHRDADILQLLGVAALLEVRPGHAHALVVGYARDAAHADATDADEMHCGDSLRFHGLVLTRPAFDPFVSREPY